MRYFFILLLTFLPLLAKANYEDEQKICAGLLPDACNIALAQYWLGEKFDETDSQIQELKEIMRNAVLSDDYSEVEKYVSFPFSFYVTDGRENKTFLRRDDKSYTWIAYNIRDFGYWFRKFKKEGEILTKDLIDESYSIYYINQSFIELISGYHHAVLALKCTQSEKSSFHVLPQNLNLCQNTSIKIQYIKFSIYN